MNDLVLSRRLAAEALGACVLVAAVVGSGIMADNLTNDIALALLANSLATGATLVVLISILGPISGAHFNPAVSLVMALSGELPRRDLVPYAAAQVVGGIAGTLIANAMFALPLLQVSATARTGANVWLSEIVATFGLVAVILIGLRNARTDMPWLVGLYITAAYWFTASTSFANPAVAIARAFTNTFSGIRPLDVPLFIIVELLGALLAFGFCRWLLAAKSKEDI